MTKLIHLVGDKFSEFARNEDVMTISRAEQLIIGGEVAREELTLFVLGQGIPDGRLAAFRQQIRAAGLEQRVQLVDERAARADSRLTHKREVQNILISSPLRNAQEDFTARLMIDERCADMSDHVTGQHIQGMLLVEAARQMFLAVTEKFFLPEDHAKDFYFVINSLDVSYYAFAFPTKLEIVYQVLDKKIDPRGTYGFDANITFWQAGVLTTKVVVKFTAYDAAFIGEREQTKARKVAAAALGEHTALAQRRTAA